MLPRARRTPFSTAGGERISSGMENPGFPLRATAVAEFDEGSDGTQAADVPGACGLSAAGVSRVGACACGGRTARLAVRLLPLLTTQDRHAGTLQRGGQRLPVPLAPPPRSPRRDPSRSAARVPSRGGRAGSRTPDDSGSTSTAHAHRTDPARTGVAGHRARRASADGRPVRGACPASRSSGRRSSARHPRRSRARAAPPCGSALRVPPGRTGPCRGYRARSTRSPPAAVPVPSLPLRQGNSAATAASREKCNVHQRKPRRRSDFDVSGALHARVY